MIHSSVPKKAGTRRVARAAIITLAAFSVMAASAGCSSSAPAASSAPTSTATAAAATITIATPTPAGTPAGVPIWIGQENGYFAAENLTVNVVTFPGQPANAVAAVVAGKADLVISAPDALIVPTANGQNLGLKWIFTPYQAPTFAIVVSAKSKIKTAAELAGKTVAMPSVGVPFETFLDSNIKGEGGSTTGVKIVAEPTTAALQSLQNGDVDAVVSSPGDIAQTEAVTGVHTTTLALAPSVKKDFGAGFLMRANSTSAQKAVYARYLRAYLKSAIFAQTNPAAAVKINWDIYPDSKPTDQSNAQALAAATASLKATVDAFVPASNGTWGYIAPSRWATHIADLGLSSKIANPSVLYDNSLLKQIGDFSVSEVRSDAAKYKK
jgi:NitT/TauT family transport system substrate-binding protein